MPWKKGESGNPRGRKPGHGSLAEYVRQKAGGESGRVYVDALHKLATAKDTPPQVQLSAITALMDRGWGRPQQTHQLVGDPSQPIHVRFGGRYRPDDAGDDG